MLSDRQLALRRDLAIVRIIGWSDPPGNKLGPHKSPSNGDQRQSLPWVIHVIAVAGQN